jgi:transcriptional regulator with XRE-family HTH domain
VVNGRKIKRYRTTLKMSQAELARLLGKSQGFISDLEGNKALVTDNILDKLAEIFKVSKSDLEVAKLPRTKNHKKK